MANTIISIDCPFCVDGKQTVAGSPVDCVSCGGSGVLTWGEINVDIDDIIVKINDIKEKVDEIKVVVDAL